MLLERDVPKLVRLRNEGDKESIVEQTTAVEVLAVTTRFNQGHRWRNLPRSTSVSCPLVFSLKQWKKQRSMNARVKTSLPKERRSTEEPPVLWIHSCYRFNIATCIHNQCCMENLGLHAETVMQMKM